MKTWIFSAIVAAFVSLPSVGLGANPTVEKDADPILGKWLWHGRIPVTITDDGKAIDSDGHRGTWKFLKNREVERKYEMIWDEGVFTDSIKLSRDGDRLEGKNQKGQRVFAIRAKVEN